MRNIDNTKICVIGLGYVGLPLAIEFSKKYPTTGFDINESRISELKKGFDSTNEVSEDKLKEAKMHYTNVESEIRKSNFIIVSVPTPINDKNEPDKSVLINACNLIGRNMQKGSIVVFESTVYPGLTEDECVPVIEMESGLEYKKDFFVGYSPERINPGDKEHTVDKIIKVVSGCDKKTAERIAEVYSSIIEAGVFIAKDIRTAEAAKVIENIQRDLNIALMNELSLLFERMNIKMRSVLEAASTKWNFLKFYPGLVGGHCIGVDPYYLTYKAKQIGFKTKVILAGRGINEYMAEHVAKKTFELLQTAGKNPETSKIYIAGLTFKENVKDYRNTKAKKIIEIIREKNIEIIGYDPLLSEKDVEKEFNIPFRKFDEIRDIDCIILCTPHNELRQWSLEDIKKKMKTPVLIDVRGIFDMDEAEKNGVLYWSLM